MSQAESFKEAIGLLKVVLGLLVAVDISLIAWLAQNYAKAQTPLLIMAWAGTMAAIVATVWVFTAAWRLIRNLKDV